MAERSRAFVLMPFAQDFRPIYDELIAPALEQAGFEVTRADSNLDQQNVLKDVVRGIASAALIVADLTALNPNVMYELGLAHALRIPTVLLTQSMEDVPFDLRSYRILRYSIRFNEAMELKQTLQEIGAAHLRERLSFGSPIIDFLPLGFQPARAEPSAGDAVPTQAADGREENGEKQLLDYLVEGEEAIGNITTIMQDVTQAMNEQSETLAARARQMQDLVADPARRDLSAINRTVISTAAVLDRFSDFVDERVPDLQASIDNALESWSGYVAWIQPDNAPGREGLTKFREQLSGLGEVTGQSLTGLAELRDSTKALAPLSKSLTRSRDRLVRSLDALMASIEQIQSYCVRTVSVIGERLT